MRPLRLQLQGFGPYKEEQNLDLAGLDLFAITGPTGAGKSTILDALVFALYGDIPRLGSRDYKDAIALGCASMVVCLDFELEKKVYRVTRRGRRTGAANAQLDEVRTAGPVGRATGVRDVNAQVTELLGVDANAFLQSVVLPQNQFARFLVSQPRDRREILTELFGLGMYERMRGLAAEQARDAKTLRDDIDRQLAGRRLVTSSDVAQLEAEAGEAAGRAAALGVEIVELEALLPALRDQASWTRDLRASEAALRGLEKDEGRIESDERRLEAHRRAAPLVPVLEQKGIAWDRLCAAEKGRDAAALRSQSLAAKVDEAQRAVNQSSSAAMAIPGLRGREAALGALATTVESLQAGMALVERLSSLLEEKALLVEERRNAQVAIAGDVEALTRAREEALAKLGAVAFDAAELERLEAVRTQAALLATRRVELASAVLAATRLRAQARDDATQAAADRAAALEADGSWRRADEASRAVAADLAEAERRHAALQLRESLSAGGLCPVCAQTVEVVPPVEVAPEVAERRQEVMLRAEAAARAAATLATAAKDANASEVVAQVSHRAALAEEVKVAELRGSVQDMTLRLLEIKGFGEDHVEVRITARLELLTAARTASIEAAQGLAECTNRLELRALELKSAASSLADAENRRAEVEADLRQARSAAEELRGRIYAETKGADVVALLERLRAQITQLDADLRSAEASLASAIRAIGDADAEHRASEAAAQVLASDHAALAARVTDELRAGGFLDEAGLRAAVLKPDLEQRLRTEVDAHLQQRAIHRQRVGELLLRLGDVRVDEAEITAEELRLKSLRADEGIAQRIAVEKQSAAGIAARDLLETTQLAEKRSRHDVNYRTQEFLQTHLQGSRFQEYVLEESFAELTRGASHRLKRLSGRYTLRPAESCGFLVVDHDNAEETRPADTLSGGETFLASLALAMELSAQVQRTAGGPTLDSIFIDEGFGTLDPDSLDVVAEAIEALPAEGRMVGIVTHVEALAERLPERVVVEKTDGGSMIRRGA